MTQDTLEDERDIELASIAAIFPELTVTPHLPHVATLEVEVAPAEPLKVRFLPQPVFSISQEAEEPEPIKQLSYLPPLLLNISLPDGYPDITPPTFSVSSTPNWLPLHTTVQLTEEGKRIWEDYGHTQVVFAYIDYLQQQAEQAFGLQHPDSSVLSLGHEFRQPLLSYDRRTKKRKFDEATFECGVCLEPKKGLVCHRMHHCGHVFCVDCLQDFYNNAITEGDIQTVRCPDPDCGMKGLSAAQRRAKKQRTLHPTELLAISIQEDRVQRYMDMKRKKKVESDLDTIYCPRSFCQAPARSAKYEKLFTKIPAEFPDSDSEDEVGEEEAADAEKQGRKAIPLNDRLRVCSACNYAFCRCCYKSWHGDYVHCRPRDPKDLTEEERLTYEYIKQHSSPCPTCAAPCQKTHGCNHMRCMRCETHFCYLCSSWLSGRNPYAHFNTPGGSCFQRLWEKEEGEEGEAMQRTPDAIRRAVGEDAIEFANDWAVAEIAEEADRAVHRVAQPVEAPRNQNGLQRFLEMAANDEEDGWDSDEFDMFF